MIGFNGKPGVRPCTVAPETLELCEDKRQRRQDQGERDVGRHRVGVRYQPDQVEHQDEHEERERIRKPLPSLLPDLSAEVAPETVELLDDHLVGAGAIFEQPAANEQDKKRHRRPEEQEPHTLVDRDVYRPDVQRDDPSMPATLEGVQDLLSQLVLAHLHEHNRTHRVPLLRSAPSST
jgi:hypothetical protein